MTVGETVTYSPKMLRYCSVHPNNVEFERSENASFLLKSTVFNVGFYLDPKKWTFTKDVDNPDAEYELECKGKDIYAMIITEKFVIPLEVFPEIALETAREVAPDAQISRAEYRTVNSHKILMMQVVGTMRGIKFTYYGYYFSNSNGSVQFICFTGQNLLEDYRTDIEEVLNGFVELS
ncbi:MAG: hypothetical protein P8Y80_04660 [Acidobacteriota bacterium]